MKSCGYKAHFEERERNSVSFGLQLWISGWKHLFYFFSPYSRLCWKSSWCSARLCKCEYDYYPPTQGKQRQRCKVGAWCHVMAWPSHQGEPGVSPPLGEPRVSPLRWWNSNKFPSRTLPAWCNPLIRGTPGASGVRGSSAERRCSARSPPARGGRGVSSELNELTQPQSAAGEDINKARGAWQAWALTADLCTDSSRVSVSSHRCLNYLLTGPRHQRWKDIYAKDCASTAGGCGMA